MLSINPFFDALGPPDGYDDLICQFNNDLRLIPEAIQPVTLTGIFTDGGGKDSPLFGTDFATSGPGGTQAIARCCTFCDDNGDCILCDSNMKGCNVLIRICDGTTICKDCTGCKRLPDAPIS